jgi:hypothetical protein
MISSEQAKMIPILDVALRLGASEPKQKRPNEIWLKSWRGEKTASLKINPVTNKFIDFGGGVAKTGSTIDAVIDARDMERERKGYARRGRKDKDAIREAIKYLEFFGNMPNVYRAPPAPEKKAGPVWVVKASQENYTARHCRAEIARRKLDFRAGEYLPQVVVENTETGKSRTVFGMDNRKGGTELHMHYPDNENIEYRNFKAVAGHKDLTVFPEHYDTKDIQIYAFSSKWDFLTLMHRQGRKKDVCYVIYHGDGLVEMCAEYIAEKLAGLEEERRISAVSHFDHTDAGGRDADHAFSRLLGDLGIPFVSKSESYKYDALNPRELKPSEDVLSRRGAYKDFSEWHMKNSGASWAGQVAVPTQNPTIGRSYRYRR